MGGLVSVQGPRGPLGHTDRILRWQCATVLAELPTVLKRNLPNTETKCHLENLSVLTLSPWIRSQ